MTTTLSIQDIHFISNEPRVQDVRIGERLGMAKPTNIRQVIEANMAELERYGLVHAARAPIVSGKGRTQEGTEYHLNEPQTLLLCMFSRTEKAADVRQEVISVYMAYRKDVPTSNEAVEQIGMRELPSDHEGACERMTVFRSDVEMMETLEHAERCLLIARSALYEMTLERLNDSAKNKIACTLIHYSDLSNEDIANEADLHPAYVEFLRQTTS